MSEQVIDQSKNKACGCSFNYCLVSKMIVAIPALPVSAYIVSLLFENPVMKCVAAGVTVALLLYTAIKIDRIPALQKKIVTYQDKK